MFTLNIPRISVFTCGYQDRLLSSTKNPLRLSRELMNGCFSGIRHPLRTVQEPEIYPLIGFLSNIYRLFSPNTSALVYRRIYNERVYQPYPDNGSEDVSIERREFLQSTRQFIGKISLEEVTPQAPHNTRGVWLYPRIN